MTKRSKEQRLLENLTRVIKQFVSGKGYIPLTDLELSQRLHLVPQHLDVLRQVLQDLVHSGEMEAKEGRYGTKEATASVVTGILRVHPRGFGFLQPDDPVTYPQDVFIPKNLTQNAVDGDRVEVQINHDVVSEKGPEGRVIAIIQRNRTHIAGTIRSVNAHGEATAYVPLLGTSQPVQVESSRDKIPLRVGDRAVMEVLEWGNQTHPTTARVSHLLGHISDPSCDITAAVEEFDLRSDFPHEVVKEAEAYGTRVSAAAMQSRENLREWTTVTIDPDTAKDFDDAISLTKDSKGNYHLGVHIADVSHYVRAGTLLDQEAALRCNSTYFPGTCVPMLPPALSENLCSLKPGVNRLTASVLMTFDARGSLIHYRVARTVIKSAKRFTYGEAKQVLDGEKTSPYAPLLHLMVELCHLLKKKRYERGSIEFSLPDLVVMVDRESGVPSGTTVISYDITHQMVEEFMLKANEVVAQHLSDKGEGLTYRVHEEPAEENIREFALLAAAFGFRISDKPTPEELQKLFEQALTTPYGPYLATSFIRSMRLAIYSAENIGHYGLRLTHYCHFTSPIRRYVDLVVHRILFGDTHEDERLDAIAKRCSEQERLSAKAEGNVVMLKKLRLIEQTLAKEPEREFEAIVTRVKPFGFTFEVLAFMLEGFAHVSQLGADYFIYDETRRRLRGRQSGKTYSSGDRVNVRLKSVDLVLLESAWELLEDLPDTPKQVPSPKRKRSKRRYAGPPKAQVRKQKIKAKRSRRR